jgi:hypothetical protein
VNYGVVDLANHRSRHLRRLCLLFQKKAAPVWFWMFFFVVGGALLFIVIILGLEYLIGPIPGLHRNR